MFLPNTTVFYHTFWPVRLCRNNHGYNITDIDNLLSDSAAKSQNMIWYRCNTDYTHLHIHDTSLYNYDDIIYLYVGSYNLKSDIYSCLLGIYIVLYELFKVWRFTLYVINSARMNYYKCFINSFGFIFQMENRLFNNFINMSNSYMITGSAQK